MARRNGASTASSLGRSDAVRRILVVEFWNIGDVVLTTPFLAAVRARFPGARVSFLGKPHAAEILGTSDLVDEVITVDFPWTAAARRYDPRRYDWPALRGLFRALRSREFDIAFESRMDPRGKLVLALTRARRRVAYDFGGCNFLLTDPVPTRDLDRHRSADWMGLLDPFGGQRHAPTPRLTVTADEAAWARGWLAEGGVAAGDRVIVIHPGASGPEKRWPIERFAEVTSVVSSREQVAVVTIEDPTGYGAGLHEISGVHGIRPTLRQLIALLAQADVLVGNDSGPMHLAAAVGTPTVAVFHPHAAREFAPMGEGHHLLVPGSLPVAQGSSPDPAALLEVSVSDMLRAIETALSTPSSSSCASCR